MRLVVGIMMGPRGMADIVVLVGIIDLYVLGYELAVVRRLRRLV
jgi:hypothetical protein